MRKVYYKGQSYNCKTFITHAGSRRFSLYDKEGLLRHFVEEQELEKRSVVKFILNAYYRSIMEEEKDPFFSELVWGAKSTKKISGLGFLNSSASVG